MNKSGSHWSQRASGDCACRRLSSSSTYSDALSRRAEGGYARPTMPQQACMHWLTWLHATTRRSVLCPAA